MEHPNASGGYVATLCLSSHWRTMGTQLGTKSWLFPTALSRTVIAATFRPNAGYVSAGVRGREDSLRMRVPGRVRAYLLALAALLALGTILPVGPSAAAAQPGLCTCGNHSVPAFERKPLPRTDRGGSRREYVVPLGRGRAGTYRPPNR